MRASLERRLVAGWSRRGWVYWAFLDLSVVFGWWVRRRRRAYACGRYASNRVPAPVVVVGNLVVGGTGKTPVTIALAEALRARGRRPGVLARGYRARLSDRPLEVEANSAPHEVGDEPLLVHSLAQVPVVVFADRVAAARTLLDRHPDVDVLICDDGLQHYPLARDVELVLFDARGAGNGRMLPAGPLREPLDRPRDATLFVGAAIDAGLAADAPAFSIPIEPGPLYRLGDRDRIRDPGSLAGVPVSAFAGLANPDKFFATLAALGARVEPHPRRDHHAYVAADLRDARTDTIVITEKDAVKCWHLAEWREDPRVWVLPIRARLPDALVDLVFARLHGPQTA